MLNDALRLDGEAINQLFQTRVPCNRALSLHPTIQVADREDGFDPGQVVGILGILNGMFSQDGKARIMMRVDDNNQIEGFYEYNG